MRVISMFAMLVAFAINHASANFITNGSFESPVQAPGTFSSFSTGSTSINGWTVVGSPDVALVNSFVLGPLVLQAQDGGNLIDLTGEGTGNSGLSQSVNTTSLANYDLTFYVGSATGAGFGASTVSLSVNGVLVNNYTNPIAPGNTINWLQFTYQFTAPTSSTLIEFRNASPGNNFSALDNVSLELTAVPEPSVILGIVGMSMALVGRVAKLRRHSRRR